jgi:hypothetical protein
MAEVSQGRTVASGWLGATLAFVLLSLAFPPAFLLALITGLIAFRFYKMAAGVTAVVVLILIAVAAFLFLYLLAVEPVNY